VGAQHEHVEGVEQSAGVGHRSMPHHSRRDAKSLGPPLEPFELVTRPDHGRDSIPILKPRDRVEEDISALLRAQPTHPPDHGCVIGEVQRRPGHRPWRPAGRIGEGVLNAVNLSGIDAGGDELPGDDIRDRDHCIRPAQGPVLYAHVHAVAQRASDRSMHGCDRRDTEPAGHQSGDDVGSPAMSMDDARTPFQARLAHSPELAQVAVPPGDDDVCRHIGGCQVSEERVLRIRSVQDGRDGHRASGLALRPGEGAHHFLHAAHGRRTDHVEDVNRVSAVSGLVLLTGLDAHDQCRCRRRALRVGLRSAGTDISELTDPTRDKLATVLRETRSHARANDTGHGMKRLLLAAVRRLGHLIYALHLHPLIIRLGRRTPKVLVYHACEETESAFIRGLGVNTHPEAFAGHLRYLERYYRVISLAELETKPALRGAVVLTFDDGYSSVFANALPRLRERGLPATIYLVSDTLRSGDPIWVNELAWWYNAGPPEAGHLLTRELDLPADASLTTVVEAIRAGYDRQLLHRLLESLRAVTDGSERPAEKLHLGPDEIEEMASAGCTFGNHTRSHPNLARLPESEQRAEMREAQRLIDDLPGACRSLAYPFGSFDARTRRLAGEQGFSSVMEVGGRNAPLRLDRVARIPVAHGGAGELFVLMEIIAPLKALARGLGRRGGQPR
jgi:peptidoglycan/xylan/chitin deacetylase (PgdA/CDA1 family)